MTMMHTESFMGFDRLTVDDTNTADNTAIRKAVADNLRTAGYDVVIGAFDAPWTSVGFIIRPDPVAPDRAAMTYSIPPTAGSLSSAAVGVRKVLPAQGRAVIGGFSLYIPQEFVVGTTATPVMAVNATPAGVAANVWNVLGGALGQATAVQVFEIGLDLKIRMRGINQSARALTPGRMHFLEFRISEGEVRVWLDDVLVLQHLTPLIAEAISFNFLALTAAQYVPLLGPGGRWAISNFYTLAEDDRAPNVRLGPTTRVIGVRPSSDVDADFQRPAGFNSNAQIASQGIVAQPALTLQAINVGDQDVYAAAGDISTPNAKLVHGVATKVLVSNLEATPHRARALIRSASGVERVDPKARELKVLPGVIAAGNRDFWHCALRPTDNAIFMCGTAETLYKTPPNGIPGSPWSMVVDGGSSTVVFSTIAFRNNGLGVIGRSDGKIQVIQPGSDTPGPVINPGAVANTNPIAGVLVTPDGAFTMTSVAQARVWRCEGDPSVPANWVAITVPGITTAMIFQRPAYAPGSNKLALITTTGLLRVSSDMGKTYVDPGIAARTSVTASRDQMGSDGSRLLYVGVYPSSTVTASTYSVDGVTWVTPSIVTSEVGTTSGGTASRIVFGAGGVFGIFTDTFWFLSTDPAQGFRRFVAQAPFTTAVYPLGACVAYNGDWIFASMKGAQLAYTTQEFDADLAPLAGYKLAFNSSTINPDTGAAWTPAEATQSQFGVRVTS